MENNLCIEQSIADSLPLMVKSKLSTMTEAQQSQFVEEYKRKRKSVGFAYFFLIVCLGIPYGYLGKWGMHIVYWFTGFGFFIWFLVLLFMLPGMVKNYNRDVAIEVIRDMAAMQ